VSPYSRYNLRGVSSDKEEVHTAIKDLDKGLFPRAFCKIFPDLVSGDPAWCNIMHTDGAGTKSSLAYLYWKENNDLSVWKGIAQDAIVMNLDDLSCAGATDHILLSSSIARNKRRIPGEVLTAIMEGTLEFMERMNEMGIEIRLTGGETADVGDLVRTIVVDSTVFCRIPRMNVIDASLIKAEDVIVGLASEGQSTYETCYTRGIGSNGLTSARHDVLDKSYAVAYPESFDELMPGNLAYSGSKKLTDPSEIDGIDIGHLLLSPTRTYAPVVKKILEIAGKEVHGIIHCTGGGQTKILHFIDRVHIIKDHLFPVPPVFTLIRNQSQTPIQEMYRVFNMGHRMEFYVPEAIASLIIAIAREFSIEARIIGRCESSASSRLTILSGNESFTYLPQLPIPTS